MLTIFLISALLSVCPGIIADDMKDKGAILSNSTDSINSIDSKESFENDRSLPALVPDEGDNESLDILPDNILGHSAKDNWKWLEDIVESESNLDNSVTDFDDEMGFEPLKDYEMVLDNVEFLNRQYDGEKDASMQSVTDRGKVDSNLNRVSPSQRRVRWDLPDNHYKKSSANPRKLSGNKFGAGSAETGTGNTPNKILYDSGSFPDLPLTENINYPPNIEDFHQDMPMIADKMEGIEFEVDPYIKLKKNGNIDTKDSEMYILPAQTNTGNTGPEPSASEQEIVDVEKNHNYNILPLSDYEEKPLKQSLSNDVFVDEIPQLSLSDSIEYPDDIEYFHGDMPKIADIMEEPDFGIDLFIEEFVLKEGMTEILQRIPSSRSKEIANLREIVRVMHAKLQEQTNGIDDIVGWPENIKLQRPWDIPSEDINQVIDKLPTLEFSRKFLDKFLASTRAAVVQNARIKS